MPRNSKPSRKRVRAHAPDHTKRPIDARKPMVPRLDPGLNRTRRTDLRPPKFPGRLGGR